MPEPRRIDLRSDTVTLPTPAMLDAMTRAEVGDDVYGEDPTVNALEAEVADYFGKEAALFVPSGTMANQVAIRAHCLPGDEMLIESGAHIYIWEAGGPAALSGVTCRTIDGEYGIFDVSQLHGKIRPNAEYYARTRIVALENTHNRGGGRIFPLEKIRAIADWASHNQLVMHLDGARLWNAIAETGITGRDWAEPFDSVSVCFSKGLGAPVGSALLGDADFILKARKLRKLFGGAMRQAGFLAAACRYAMTHHVERLAEDHANARLIGEAVGDVPGLRLDPETVETNLVWIAVDPALGTAQELSAKLAEQNVQIAALGSQMLRACTHLDVSRADCELAADLLRKLTR